MCKRFQDAEKEYLKWLDENPTGFVFNNDVAGRVLHKATCGHLKRVADSGRRTVSPKLCCVSKDCILEQLRVQYGEEDRTWRRCRALGSGCWM